MTLDKSLRGTIDDSEDARRLANVDADSVTTDSATVNGATATDTLEADDIGIGSSDFVSNGDFVAVGPSWGPMSVDKFATTQNSYENDADQINGYLDAGRFPSGSQIAVESLLTADPGSGSMDVRLLNARDAETVWEETNISSRTDLSKLNSYTPFTTSGITFYRLQIKSNTGDSVTVNNPIFNWGIQL
jgi:hypothetical protein